MSDSETVIKDDEYWMRLALQQAQNAAIQGEVPVGAVVVQDDKFVASAHNQPIALNDPTAHAEILALRAAAQTLENYRMPDATLYVTLEPCPMCVGAIVHARIKRLVFAADDEKTGAVGGCFDLLDDTRHNHRPVVEHGLLREDSATLLQSFFRQRR